MNHKVKQNKNVYYVKTTESSGRTQKYIKYRNMNFLKTIVMDIFI